MVLFSLFVIHLSQLLVFNFPERKCFFKFLILAVCLKKVYDTPEGNILIGTSILLAFIPIVFSFLLNLNMNRKFSDEFKKSITFKKTLTKRSIGYISVRRNSSLSARKNILKERNSTLRIEFE